MIVFGFMFSFKKCISYIIIINNNGPEFRYSNIKHCLCRESFALTHHFPLLEGAEWRIWRNGKNQSLVHYMKQIITLNY